MVIVTDRLTARIKKNRQTYHNDMKEVNILRSYLKLSEKEVEADDILQAIENNIRDKDALDICNVVLYRFTYKAIQTNYSYQYLQCINKLIKYHATFDAPIPSSLYIIKANCLKQFSTFDNRIEECLEEAICTSSNNSEKMESLIMLAYYYDGIGAYIRMQKILLQAKDICQIYFINHIYMAETMCALGYLSFTTFNLGIAKKYFSKSLDILNYINKNKNDSVDEFKYIKICGTCLHYLGRIKLEQYKFKDCVDLYIQAELTLVDFCINSEITQDNGATAYYHLRLAQVLEICGITNSANYHYKKSYKLFNESNSVPSGFEQAKLAISKQEQDLKESIQRNIVIGYSRGYFLASIKLFLFYAKNLKIVSAVRLIFVVFINLLTDSKINFIDIVILVKQIFSASYGMGLFVRLNVLYLKLIKSDTLLSKCPCPDPDCKKDILDKD